MATWDAVKVQDSLDPASAELTIDIVEDAFYLSVDDNFEYTRSAVIAFDREGLKTLGDHIYNLLLET